MPIFQCKAHRSSNRITETVKLYFKFVFSPVNRQISTFWDANITKKKTGDVSLSQHNKQSNTWWVIQATILIKKSDRMKFLWYNRVLIRLREAAGGRFSHLSLHIFTRHLVSSVSKSRHLQIPPLHFHCLMPWIKNGGKICRWAFAFSHICDALWYLFPSRLRGGTPWRNSLWP